MARAGSPDLYPHGVTGGRAAAACLAACALLALACLAWPERLGECSAAVPKPTIV